MQTVYGVAVKANDEGGDEVLAATKSRTAAEKHAAEREGVYVIEIAFFNGELVTKTQHRVQCWVNADGIDRPKGPKSGDHRSHHQFEVFVVDEGCSWDLYPKSTWASCWGVDGDECEARLDGFLATIGGK